MDGSDSRRIKKGDYQSKKSFLSGSPGHDFLPRVNRHVEGKLSGQSGLNYGAGKRFGQAGGDT